MAPRLGSNRYAALFSEEDEDDDFNAQTAEETVARPVKKRTAKKKKQANIAAKEGTVADVSEQPAPKKGQKKTERTTTSEALPVEPVAEVSEQPTRRKGKKRRRTATSEATPVEPVQELASLASAAAAETSKVNSNAPQLRSNRYAALLSDDDDDDDDDVQNGSESFAARPASGQTTKKENACAKKAAKNEMLGEPNEPKTGQKRKRAAATEATPAKQAQQLASSAQDEAPLPAGTTRTLQGGVTIKVIRAAPQGATVARHGCEVKLLYEGSLPNKKGLRFDAGEIDFLLGDGTMLRGFAMGVVGMHVGERRLIHIPWRLGYGKKGKPPKIPPMSDLDFDASLVFCGVDWEHRISDKRSDMSNKRREAGKRRGKKPKAT